MFHTEGTRQELARCVGETAAIPGQRAVEGGGDNRKKRRGGGQLGLLGADRVVPKDSARLFILTLYKMVKPWRILSSAVM